ncbi:MAG TPA: hypothetical protein VGS12_03795 [Caulobacteraceae bacterium]|nr:hypothetical protein [Caulobacteraceae bacterium]
METTVGTGGGRLRGRSSHGAGKLGDVRSAAAKLTLVRGAHTVIYVVMASASFVALYAGVTGRTGTWLWAALALVGIETVIFVGNGFACPFTAVAAAASAGAPVSDTFFPERITRHTLRFFGPLIAIAIALLISRWAGLLT